MDDFITRMNARRRELFGQLATLPAVDITGVVHASGPGGSLNEGKTWDFQLTFAAWRVGSGPIRRDELSVTRVTATQDEFDSLFHSIGPEAIVRVRARHGVDQDGKPAALVDEYLGLCDSDPELDAERERLREPVTFTDPQLGEFRLERGLRYFTSEQLWKSDPMELSLDGESQAEVEPALAVARELWAQQDHWNQRIQDAAVEALLPLKNDTWLEDGESEVTDDEFKARMLLSSVAIRPDGEFTFWYDDDGLFFGHSITVRGTLQDGPTDANIEG